MHLGSKVSQVKTANAYNLSFFATGGGHGGETGFATVNQAVNIDLSNFNENNINLTDNTLSVGPGVSFVDFETNLYNVGKVLREFCPHPQTTTITHILPYSRWQCFLC